MKQPCAKSQEPLPGCLRTPHQYSLVIMVLSRTHAAGIEIATYAETINFFGYVLLACEIWVPNRWNLFSQAEEYVLH